MIADEIRLTLPADDAFHSVAHLVLGGLAARLDLSFENLEDLELALDALLERPNDGREVTLHVFVDDSELRMVVGPFTSVRAELEEGGGELAEPRPDPRCRFRLRRDRGSRRLAVGRAHEAAGQHEGRWQLNESDKVLLRRYHENGDLQAREQLIERYMSLVRSLARRYSYRGEQLDDLVQIGAIGLIKAIDRFDIDRGVELTTYATPNIIGEIKRHFRDKGWSVRVPRGLQELNVQLSKLVEQLTVQLARSPTIAELAKGAGVEEEEVLEALESGRAYSSLSLSTGSGGSDDGEELDPLESIGTLEHQYDVSEDRAVLAPGFRVLDERERMILHLRFFEGLTQSQIAQQVGISQMHVSRLIRRSLEKIRDEIAAEEDTEPKVRKRLRSGPPAAAPTIEGMRTSAELRAGFRAFYESKGHVFRPSAPLVPRADDRSTLLTTAGMQPLMPYFLGREAPPAPLLTTVQKCFRTPDIDEVGLDGSHLTFFEMLGNFSFGQYFKEGAIDLAWEFVFEHLKLDPERFWVSVFAGDPELGLGEDNVAYDHWVKIGQPTERIVFLPRAENFWSVGGPGRAGPTPRCTTTGAQSTAAASRTASRAARAANASSSSGISSSWSSSCTSTAS